MGLFSNGEFKSAAGIMLDWKIECDFLTPDDWGTIAKVAARQLPPFYRALGIPRGGSSLARALSSYSQTDSTMTLLVDDVWTTGKSMNEFVRHFEITNWMGFVAFSRGDLPPNVHSFMDLGGLFR